MNCASPQQMASAARTFRQMARTGRWRGPSAGAAPGALQANLAFVPAEVAPAFETFCLSNPKPCPLLAKTEPGSPLMPALGEDVNAATDAPAYRLFRNGERAERVDSLEPYWREDMVGFAIGCSFSFEAAMQTAGVPVRHIDRNENVAMYRSSLQTTPSGPFAGPMVVSMRPIRPEQAALVTEICARFPFAHGAPVHIGDPAEIGINDVHTPDFGDAPTIEDGEICAFWACGVTPQLALLNAGLDFAASHEPGCMLVTDLDAAAPDLPGRSLP